MKLKQRIQDIYDNHTPFENMDRQLVGQAFDGTFRNSVENRCQDLPLPEKDRILAELFGWGPLDSLIHNKNIFDILVQGSQCIYFEDSQGLKKHGDCFLSERSYKNFVNMLLKRASLLINQRDPYGNGKLMDFRVHIIGPPLAQDYFITLRRHQQKNIPLQTLLEQKFISKRQLQFFHELLKERKNFIILGPTGSGKTTFLNSLLSETDATQRSLIIEDTDEIKPPNSLSCKLLSRDICPDTLKPIPMEELLKQSLRMRPDRIIVGEIRGREAKDLLMALSTGHAGSAGTMHAESASQALLRLEMLIQMGAPHWSLYSIRQLIKMSLQYLVVLESDRQQKGVQEIFKIGSHESFGLLLEKVNC